MPALSATDWSDIDALRERIAVRAADASSIEEVAQGFTEDAAAAFPGVVLARIFLVLPLASLPPAEQSFAIRLAGNDPRIHPGTRVLSLLGTFGRAPDWRDRHRSRGHLAIPLIDRAFVLGIPMITKLLADLEVDLAAFDNGLPIATRRMLGGLNGAFLVPDARVAADAQGRKVIPASDFVAGEKIITVFGMGGAYVDGTLAVCIFFTRESVDRLYVDRFPSLISNFKMATSKLLVGGRIYREQPPA